nr:MAG TPA: K Centromere-associated protein K [Bacteriophage sp.]
MINAHVDIAKDPYITRLNVNPYTYNLVNLLLRVGLGEDTFYFTT